MWRSLVCRRRESLIIEKLGTLPVSGAEVEYVLGPRLDVVGEDVGASKPHDCHAVPARDLVHEVAGDSRVDMA